MRQLDELRETIACLRSEDGCPWDREQTHESLKPACIEEAAEVISGINILSETGSADNLKEELGDLLLQVVMHAQIAEEEGLFTLEDVVCGVNDKMIRRHPHVFGGGKPKSAGEVPAGWKEIKGREKAGREWEESFLPKAFEEVKQLIEKAKERKGF